MTERVYHVIAPSGARVAVLTDGSQATIQPLTRWPLAGEWMAIVRACIPLWDMQAEHGNVIARRKSGMSGCIDYTIRETRDVALRDYPVAARLHVTMYGKVGPTTLPYKYIPIIIGMMADDFHAISPDNLVVLEPPDYRAAPIQQVVLHVPFGIWMEDASAFNERGDILTVSRGDAEVSLTVTYDYARARGVPLVRGVAVEYPMGAVPLAALAEEWELFDVRGETVWVAGDPREIDLAHLDKIADAPRVRAGEDIPPDGEFAVVVGTTDLWLAVPRSCLGRLLALIQDSSWHER